MGVIREEEVELSWSHLLKTEIQSSGCLCFNGLQWVELKSLLVVWAAFALKDRAERVWATIGCQ